MPFDMPDGTHTFEERGGWVVNSLMTEFSLTREQAAGIAGNCGYESGGFKVLQEAGVSSYERGGYGWSQWTGPRRVAFEGWCQAQGLEPSSDEANYGYLCVELHGAYASCIKALRACQTIEAAVFTWGRLYEGPGGTTATYLPGNDGRLDYARRALAGSQASLALGIPAAAAPVVATTMPEFTAEQLQVFLQTKGIYKGAIDGDFGIESEAALLAYLGSK